MDVEEIRVKIKKLPDHLIPEVLDYIEFLLNKYANKETVESKNKFKFNWEGGLSKLKDQYTSVELQHKAMDWR
jgi:hypothetical protein